MVTPEEDKIFSDTETTEIRNRAKMVIEDAKLSAKSAADEAGIGYSTFHAWLSGTYKGKNNRVTDDANKWLVARTEKQRRLQTVQKPPCFQNTPSAKEFMEHLHYAQSLPELVVIAAASGIGKTTAAEQYRKQNPNVWLATMSPATSTVNGMLKHVCRKLGIAERRYGELVDAIGRRVANTGGLIIIDEAQHLAPLALDQLRYFFDEYGVGLAFIGNEEVYARLEGDGTTAKFAQIYSRVGGRTAKTKPTANDISMLLDAWGVKDAGEIKLLKAIALKPGALRRMTKCLQLASMLAAGAQEPRAEKHLRAAFARISNQAATS